MWGESGRPQNHTMSVLPSDWFTGWTVGDRVGWSVSLESGLDLDRRIMNVGSNIVDVNGELSEKSLYTQRGIY